MTANPLAELDDWWSDRHPDDEDCDTILDRYTESGESCVVEFATIGGADTAFLERAEWRLEIEGCVEGQWRTDCGNPEWFEEHPLLSPYHDLHAWISFSQPFKDPLRALGAVAQAHEEMLGEWVNLTRYLRLGMLNANFGILAEGPATILAAYERALRSAGADVAMASREKPSGFHDPHAPLSVATWGASYFVASLFRLVRIA